MRSEMLNEPYFGVGSQSDSLSAPGKDDCKYRTAIVSMSMRAETTRVIEGGDAFMTLLFSRNGWLSRVASVHLLELAGRQILSNHGISSPA
jgi:hypothetical protein